MTRNRTTPVTGTNTTASVLGSAAGVWSRPFPLTDLPTWLMLSLVALGLPRTILADLGIVPPESGLLYYVLALAPFVAWLAVAILRTSGKPFRDFVILGLLYGLSLALVHQALWDAGPSLGHQPPQAAFDFADNFAPGLRELAVRAYTVGIALMIGLGTGLVAALVARTTDVIRRHRPRPTA